MLIRPRRASGRHAVASRRLAHSVQQLGLTDVPAIRPRQGEARSQASPGARVSTAVCVLVRDPDGPRDGRRLRSPRLVTERRGAGRRLKYGAPRDASSRCYVLDHMLRFSLNVLSGSACVSLVRPTGVGGESAAQGEPVPHIPFPRLNGPDHQGEGMSAPVDAASVRPIAFAVLTDEGPPSPPHVCGPRSGRAFVLRCQGSHKLPKGGHFGVREQPEPSKTSARTCGPSASLRGWVALLRATGSRGARWADEISYGGEPRS